VTTGGRNLTPSPTQPPVFTPSPLATTGDGWLSGPMAVFPMFPLGSVLFPGMPLALRVFEERYLKMMGAILEEDSPQFGVVLIERGHEVGGGEKRFDVGTLAEVLEIAAPDGPLAVVARGTRRFRVASWLDDDPYPRAEIELFDSLASDSDTDAFLQETEQVVRNTLRYLESLTDDVPWSADIDLSSDDEERLWQLAGISPLGPLDHQDFLSETSMASLSTKIQTTVSEALEVLRLSQESQGEDN
jgi:Lon protease-like protein